MRYSPGFLSSTLSSPWTPADITTDLWLDAADTDTITESGGDVSQWDDKSGNDNHVTQDTGSKQPTTGTRTQNGLNVLDFDGNDEMNKVFAVSQPYSVFAVAKSDDASGTRFFFGNSDSSPLIYLGHYGSFWRWYVGAQVNGSATDTNYHLFSAVADGATSITEMWLDGTSEGTAAGTFDLEGVTIGESSGFWDGTVSEVILLGSHPSDAERQKVEGYLAWKWGTEGNLPVGHPYKNAAPTA